MQEEGNFPTLYKCKLIFLGSILLLISFFTNNKITRYQDGQKKHAALLGLQYVFLLTHSLQQVATLWAPTFRPSRALASFYYIWYFYNSSDSREVII
jgi:hypothetical protein